MENTEKIINALKQFVTLKGSQNKAATALGISAATLSKILNGKTDDIADEMWRILAAKTGSTGKRQWFTAQTGSYNQLMFVFANAQNDALACAVCGEAGGLWQKHCRCRIRIHTRKRCATHLCRVLEQTPVPLGIAIVVWHRQRRPFGR